MAPALLVEQFGPPSEGDGYKVSGSYTFVSQTQEVFTLYDWRATTLFWEEEDDGAPTPAEFWEDPSPNEFHIGGHGKDISSGQNPEAVAFREWLLELHRDFQSARVK